MHKIMIICACMYTYMYRVINNPSPHISFVRQGIWDTRYLPLLCKFVWNLVTDAFSLIPGNSEKERRRERERERERERDDKAGIYREGEI